MTQGTVACAERLRDCPRFKIRPMHHNVEQIGYLPLQNKPAFHEAGERYCYCAHLCGARGRFGPP